MPPRILSLSRAVAWIAAAGVALALDGCQPQEREAAAPPASEPVAAADTATLWVEAGAVFVWPRVPRADLYRIELFDEGGALLGGAVTRDTTVPAGAVVPDTAHAGSWRVVPVTAGGTELASQSAGRFQRR